MKISKMPPRMRILFSIGILLSTSIPFIHVQFPGIPDFLIGSLSGIGLGLMIAVMIKQKRKKRVCSSAEYQA